MRHDFGAFTFNKLELRALTQFSAPAGMHRENLSVVYLDPRIGSAVATDGSTLAIVKNGSNDDSKESFSVSLVFVKQCLAMLSKKDDEVTISYDGTRVTAHSSSGLVVMGIPEESKFPDYTGVCPGLDL